jgi:hypothetical protein
LLPRFGFLCLLVGLSLLFSSGCKAQKEATSESAPREVASAVPSPAASAGTTQVRVATVSNAPSGPASCLRDLLPFMTSQSISIGASRQCELADTDQYWIHFSEPDSNGVIYLESISIVLFFTGDLGGVKDCADVAKAELLWPIGQPIPASAFRGQCEVRVEDLDSPEFADVETLAPLPAAAAGKWVEGDPCFKLPIFYGGLNDNPTPFTARCSLNVRS